MLLGSTRKTVRENAGQESCYALCRLDSRDHQQLCIHICKVELVSGITDQLCQKYSLCSAVTFAEGMEHIGSAIKVYQLSNKFVSGQSFEIITGMESFEDHHSLIFNVFSRYELSAFLADINSTHLASPIV